MTEIPVISGKAVLEAIDARTAIERTRHAFERYADGDWEMPAKVYLDSPPYGDFRAMPARGDGIALLKWVTSFPGNSATGLPVVRGEVLLSDAETGEELAMIECSSVTSLRTGAAAAVSAQVLALDDAVSVGIVGCGVNGAWSARCLAAAGYEEGVCADVRPEAASALADELSPGQHLAVLGADAHGKQEVELDAIRRCTLFCDEWEQASTGGELANAVEAGEISRDDVTQIGDVLTGNSTWTRSDGEITLFDSTGLAIQDLAICREVYERWRRGQVNASMVSL